MNDDIVFIIPSVIYFANRELSYSETRSVYSPRVRARQTKEGIESIRRLVPKSKVILVELGLQRNLPYSLEKLSDAYVYGGKNQAIRRITDGINKGHGEAVALLLADKAVNGFQAKYFFKLSGRYKLNHDFNLQAWLPSKNTLVAKKYNDNCISTRLYGFSAEFYETWRRGIFKAIPDLRCGWAFEDTLPKVISTIQHLEPIGVSGLIAPHGVTAIE